MHHNVDTMARIDKLVQIRRIQLDEFLKFRTQRYDLDRVAHCAGGAKRARSYFFGILLGVTLMMAFLVWRQLCTRQAALNVSLPA